MRARPFRSIPLWQEPIRQSNLTIMPQPRPLAVIAAASSQTLAIDEFARLPTEQQTDLRRACETGRVQGPRRASGRAGRPARETAPGKPGAVCYSRSVAD